MPARWASLRAAVLRDQKIGFDFGLGHFLFEAVHGVAQRLHLMRLLFHLLGEIMRRVFKGERTLKRGPGERFVLLAQREFGLTQPIALRGQTFFVFFLKQMLVRNSHGHLRLYLHELVLHIKEKLLEQLLRIFGFLNQVIQIGPDECCHSF